MDNILTSRALLTGSALKKFNETVHKESVHFIQSTLGTGVFTNKAVPKKVGKFWYIEQLFAKAKGGWEVRKVRADKVNG